MFNILGIFFLTIISSTSCADYINDTFPPWFEFGAATAAYQIEGAWRERGKGPSIWDTYTHEYRWIIADHHTGDISTNSYHKFREDIEIAHSMGLNFLRFSISWPRVLPYGYSNYVNKDGVRFYNNVIDTLLAHNITPMVTMYHWDLPQELQNIGGWPNPLMMDYYVDYARFLFETFGDRVKTWLTFNEPKNICALGYGTIYLAPGYVNQSGIADYLCGYTILLAHAKTYHMYKDEYQEKQGGRISLSLDTDWYEPDNNEPENVEAAFRKIMFTYGWFMNPLFSKEGNYPQIMIDRVGLRSKLENFPRSRLPAFTQEQIEYMRGTYDFLGLNIYTSSLAANPKIPPPIEDHSYFADAGVLCWQPASWINTSFVDEKVTPWGARKLLDFTKNYYGDFPIIITENGYADRGEIKDYGRVEYYKTYLNEIQLAIVEDKVNVIAYTAWSLLDNFEWTYGYTEKYGLNHVDFDDPQRTRLMKNSGRCYTQFIKQHAIDWDCTGDLEPGEPELP